MKAMKSARGKEHSLSVVCVSWGGTKLEIGVLTREGAFRSSPRLYWREDPAFAGFVNDGDASHFCDASARWVSDFLKEHGYALSDTPILGIPFPGPKNAELWYSNNLVHAFRRGVALESEMTDALLRVSGSKAPPLVKVIFDAQCDAGGELFHPAGWFAFRSGVTPPLTGTVLNIATGIAAGFIDEGRVLIGDEDFQSHVDGKYDGGAGQLGRHLFYHQHDQRWEYHFWPHGQLPQGTGSAIRMTDRLSGPALAARLLLQLGHNSLLSADTWTIPYVRFSQIEELYRVIASHQPDRETAAATEAVRGASHPVAGALLEWADNIYRLGIPATIASCIHSFAIEIAAELAAALRAWMRSPGWERFGSHIILTGGAGTRFLASSDTIPGRSFLHALRSRLGTACGVDRSRLLGATERECYLFLHYPNT